VDKGMKGRKGIRDEDAKENIPAEFQRAISARLIIFTG
jgi:hypothetical protein